MADHLLTYTSRSTLDGSALGFATSGGREAHPAFFRGFLDNAPQAARALVAISEVSRARYFDARASARLRDPVVTSNVDVLRFEAFSSCNGVYARFDVDAEGFDAEWLDWGTTNVDLNDPVRLALASVAPGEPMRLTVGGDGVGVETMDAAHVELKVPLPERWLRGFAEAQIVASAMQPVASISGAAAMQAVRELPKLKTTPRTPWVTIAPGKPRTTSVQAPGAACLIGPQRLGSLAMLAPYAKSLSVYAAPPATRAGIVPGAHEGTMLQASAWVLHLDNARFTLVVSPELYRGFSGEGAILTSLATVPEEHVAAVGALLAGQSALTPREVGADAGLSEADALGALRVLGGAGRVGFDTARGAFFHRDLPYDRGVLGEAQPRLRNAWDLVAAGAVTVSSDAAGGVAYFVRSDTTSYRVTLDDDGGRCECDWFVKHRGERGPCKHLIAATLTAGAALARS